MKKNYPLVKELYKKGSKKWVDEKVQLLKAAADRNLFQKNLYQSHLLALDMYINMLLQYKEHLSMLEAEIDTLAKDIDEFYIKRCSRFVEKVIKDRIGKNGLSIKGLALLSLIK